MFQKEKELILSSISILNKNLPVYLFAVALSLIPIYFENKFLTFAILIIGIAWSGTQIALLRDSSEHGKAKWNNLSNYLILYFKKLWPLLIVELIATFLGMIVVLVVFAFYAKYNLGLDSKEEFANFSTELINFLRFSIRSPKYLLAALPLSLIMPYLYCFIPIIVLGETSIFKSIKKTFQFLRSNLKFYFLLLVIMILYTVVTSIVYGKLNISIIGSEVSLLTRTCIALINQYFSLFIASLIIIYYLNKDH